MQKLEKEIKKIIQSIKLGYYFDAHTVISLLLQKHHDVYLLGSKNYTSTRLYHAAISRMVKANTGLVKNIGKSYSKNVLDKFSGCHLWQRK